MSMSDTLFLKPLNMSIAAGLGYALLTVYLLEMRMTNSSLTWNGRAISVMKWRYIMWKRQMVNVYLRLSFR